MPTYNTDEDLELARLQNLQLRNQQLQYNNQSPEGNIRDSQDFLMKAVLSNKPQQVFRDVQGINDIPTNSVFAPLSRADNLSTYMGGLAPTAIGLGRVNRAMQDATDYYGKGVQINDGLEEDMPKVQALRKEYNQDRVNSILNDKNLDTATKYKRMKDLATQFANDSRVQTIQNNLRGFQAYQADLNKMLQKGAKDGGIDREQYDFLLRKARRDYAQSGGAYNDTGEVNQIGKYFGSPASYVDLVEFNNKIGEGWKAEKGSELIQTVDANGQYIWKQRTKNGIETVNPDEVRDFMSRAMKNDPFVKQYLQRQGEIRAFNTNPDNAKQQMIGDLEEGIRRIQQDANPAYTRDQRERDIQSIRDRQAIVGNLNSNQAEQLFANREMDRIIGDYAQGGANKFGFTNRETERIQDVDANQVWKWNYDIADKQREEALAQQQWSYNEDLGQTALKPIDEVSANPEEIAGVSKKEYTNNLGGGAVVYTDSKGNIITAKQYNDSINKAQEAIKSPAGKFNYLIEKNPQFAQFVQDNGGIGAFGIQKASDYNKVFNKYNEFVKKNKVFEATSNFITDPKRRTETLQLAKSSPTLKIYDSKGKLVEEGDTETMMKRYMGVQEGDWTNWGTPDKDTKWKISSSPYDGLVITSEGGTYKAVATPRELFNEVDGSGMSAMNVGLKRALVSGKPQQVNQLVGDYQVPMVVSPNFKLRSDNKVGAKVNIDYQNSNLPDNYKQALQTLEAQQGSIQPQQLWEVLGIKDPIQTMFVKPLSKE